MAMYSNIIAVFIKKGVQHPLTTYQIRTLHDGHMIYTPTKTINLIFVIFALGMKDKKVELYLRTVDVAVDIHNKRLRAPSEQL